MTNDVQSMTHYHGADFPAVARPGPVVRGGGHGRTTGHGVLLSPRILLLLTALVAAGCAGSGSAGTDPRVQACKDNFPPYNPARESCLAGIESSDDETETKP